jgi:Ser/Thr protein kinase RdoA (MazF antagonist)
VQRDRPRDALPYVDKARKLAPELHEVVLNRAIALELSGDRAAMTLQLSHVLAGYEDFMTLDRRELNLVEALRTLRLIHYSAWISRRWDDPAFPAAFPWFNTQRYWQDRILELREQIALMEEEPLNP